MSLIIYYGLVVISIFIGIFLVWFLARSFLRRRSVRRNIRARADDITRDKP